jgi:hypothetical protein|tara:strand:- start:511 stop:693 length:183 start_codon:yes stop_codon:yes gene_type:complete
MSKKQYTYKEATPKQIKDWQENELKWWSDNALRFVVYASILQVGTILFMGLNFYLISLVT